MQEFPLQMMFELGPDRPRRLEVGVPAGAVRTRPWGHDLPRGSHPMSPGHLRER